MNIFGHLYWWRLRHFATATYKLLARRWQAALFVLLMASPAMMPFVEQIHLLGAPVLLIVQPGQLRLSASLWLLMLIAAWSWSALQSKALGGGDAWRHLLSMPLSPRLVRAVDLAVLSITDAPLFLPFIAAVVTLALSRPFHASAVAAVVALSVQLPVAQWLALQRSRRIAWCLAGSFLGLLSMEASGTPWSLAALAMAGTLAGLSMPRWRPIPAIKQDRATHMALRLHSRRHAAVNLMLVNVRFLFGSRQFSQHLGLLLCLPLPLVLLEVARAMGMSDAVLRVALILCMVPLLFHLAGLTFDLRRLHTPMQRLYAALGVRPILMMRVNLAVLEATFAVFSAPLVATIYLATGSANALWVWPVGMSALGINAWLNHRETEGSLVAKLLISALACAALARLLTQ